MYSIGLEQEFFLLDTNYNILSLCPNEITQIFGKDIKIESFCAQIEINTPICMNIEDLEIAYQRIYDKLYEKAEKHGLKLLHSATPIGKIDTGSYIINPNKRIKSIRKKLGLVLNNALCCSVQYHVQTIKQSLRYPIINYIRPYLPLFLALSANSPFWNGQNTELKSYRAYSFQSLPNTGLPPTFEHMIDYEKYVEGLIKTTSINTPKELWWDLRAHYIYPTIECRILDNIFRQQDIIALAAFYQALVYTLEQKIIRGEQIIISNYLIDCENKWRAARNGLSATFIESDGYSTITCKKAIQKLIAVVEKNMYILGSEKKINDILDILIHGNGAEAQLKIYQNTQSLKSIMENFCKHNSLTR